MADNDILKAFNIEWPGSGKETIYAHRMVPNNDTSITFRRDGQTIYVVNTSHIVRAYEVGPVEESDKPANDLNVL